MSSETKGCLLCHALFISLRIPIVSNTLVASANNIFLLASRYEQCDPNVPNRGFSRSLYDDATVVEYHVLRSAKTDAAGDDPIPLGATPRSKSGKTEKEKKTKNQVRPRSKRGKTVKENSYETKNQAKLKSKNGKTKKESSEIKDQVRQQ